MSDRPDQLLDASGLNCPLPLLKAKQALNRLQPGQVLKVIATDAGSVRDFQAFTDQSDHELLESFRDAERFIYVIRRGLKTRA
ncbi:sulfurtransferase TusA family protein [Nitrincola tapanii]|uniref:Sulfurtransferase TusA family protein n=1 Tax=Nitrincola tapanii TaxID=1708751 RepID=A0A5A9W4P9_9GAMM|nr:sulfurtransferase TusA family protein [Nitrincola tapanii]KAA0875125.1 sulfurtransferase TusA family protein [Nitrincola tapanii]